MRVLSKVRNMHVVLLCIGRAVLVHMVCPGDYGAASSLSTVSDTSSASKTLPYVKGKRPPSVTPVITLSALLSGIPEHIRIPQIKTDMQVRSLLYLIYIPI